MSEQRASSLSSSNGLRHVLSGSRKQQKKQSEQAKRSSITSNNSSEGHHGIRKSIESAIDRLKHGDGHDDGEDHGLSKLVPSRIKSKHRRQKAVKEEEEASDDIEGDADRGRRIAERGTLDDDNKSFMTMGDGDQSSLITYESETES